MDAVVLEMGVDEQLTLDGQVLKTPTAKIRFVDGTRNGRSGRPHACGPHYIVLTPLGETTCSTAQAIVEAIANTWHRRRGRVWLTSRSTTCLLVKMKALVNG